MKKIYIFLASLLVVNVTFSQWVQQNSGTTKNLNSVYFTDLNIGYVVGDSGIILKTSDGGNQWATIPSGTTNDLKSISFPSTTTGYAVGGNGTILKTFDGGATWAVQTSGTNAQLIFVHFPVQDTGYIAGWNCLLKTTNGGSSWIKIDSVWYPESVFFIDANIGYTVGDDSWAGWGNIVRKTVDGGINWTNQTVGFDLLTSLYFIDEMTGYAVGSVIAGAGGSVHKTTDGGITWTSQDIFLSPRSVFFPNADTGYIAGYSIGLDHGAIFKTTDGGITWFDPLSVLLPINLNSTVFFDGLTGYTVGLGGTILKTDNGGITAAHELQQSRSVFELFPNPSSDLLNLEISEPTSCDRVTIINSQGQILQEHIIISINLLQLDISRMSTGIYYIELQNGHSSIVRKFMKQ